MNRPQVLLLGNGLNLSYGGVSWTQLLKSINVNDHINDKTKLKCPMPLQAVLYTNNDIKSAMEDQKKNLFGSLETEQQINALRRILSLGFDEILTTNYSYELELAAIGHNLDDDRLIKKMAEHTRKVKRVEGKYLLHSYNRVVFNGVENRVWHIHGESRKPDSMILGHYYYANLLSRMIQYVKEREDQYEYSEKNGLTVETDSWLDAFIIGDVYILGFGCDVSEFDLWWLLNRKKRERAQTGKVFFFEPRTRGFNEKIELMRLLDVRPEDCGMEKPAKNDPEKTEKYMLFYEKAINRICELMAENKGL